MKKKLIIYVNGIFGSSWLCKIVCIGKVKKAYA